METLPLSVCLWPTEEGNVLYRILATHRDRLNRIPSVTARCQYSRLWSALSTAGVRRAPIGGCGSLLAMAFSGPSDFQEVSPASTVERVLVCRARIVSCAPDAQDLMQPKAPGIPFPLTATFSKPAPHGGENPCTSGGCLDAPQRHVFCSAFNFKRRRWPCGVTFGK